MKKIAYIELDTHAEIALNFMQLAEGFNDFSVDYYFSEKIAGQINPVATNIMVCKPSEILNKLDSASYDLVIIGTVHRYFNLFRKITGKFCTAVICHNLNFCAASRWQLLKGVMKKDKKYRLKLLFKEGLLTAPEIYSTAGIRFVLDEGLLGHQKLKSTFLPLFYLGKEEITKTDSVITVVVPGSVSRDRRDYLHLLSSLKTFSKKHSFRIIFLGKAQGEELQWLQKAEKEIPANVTLTYFDQKVPQNIFDQWMEKADLLWCPIKKEIDFFGVEEIYGTTKMSGNVGDAIKYGKRAVFPAAYENPYPFIIPEENEVEQQLIRLLEKDKFPFKDHFGKEKIRKQLESLLSDLL